MDLCFFVDSSDQQHSAFDFVILIHFLSPNFVHFLTLGTEQILTWSVVNLKGPGPGRLTYDPIERYARSNTAFPLIFFK